MEISSTLHIKLQPNNTVLKYCCVSVVRKVARVPEKSVVKLDMHLLIIALGVESIHRHIVIGYGLRLPSGQP